MKITIRPTRKNGTKAWMVDWRSPGGKRQRRFFGTKAAAEAMRDEIGGQVSRTGDVWQALTAKERDQLLGILSVAKERSLNISDLCVQMTHGQLDQELTAAPLIETAITECLASKRAGNRREGYVKDLKLVLFSFAKGRKTQRISEVKSADIEAWISGKYTNLHSKATALNRVNTLFSFAVRQGYLRNNPCDRIERVTIDHQAPQILTHDESTRLMAAVRAQCPRGLAWFAMALFAGVRPEEADKLTWDAIDLKRGIIQIDAAAAKVRQRRIVHLLPAAIAWLQVAKDCKADLPIPNVSRRRMQRDLRATMKWDAWPQDILRHTAASYWLALVQDAGKVAHELGNSAGILLRHYRELVTREDAAVFWAIMPQRDAPSGEHPTKNRGVCPSSAGAVTGGNLPSQ